MSDDRAAKIHEAEHALEILRERKASFNRNNRTIRLVMLPFVVVVGGVLAVVVLAGIVKGEIGYWPLLFGGLYLGFAVLVWRMTFARDATPADHLLGLWGYRRSDGAILDEQIAEYEQRLKDLQRE